MPSKSLMATRCFLVATATAAAATDAAGAAAAAQAAQNAVPPPVEISLLPCITRPLATPGPQREVFAYWSTRSPVVPWSWQSLDWGRMTTLAVFEPWPPPPELVCHAHSRGVRVVSADGVQWMHTALRSNASYRAAWVDNHVDQMVASGTDGVNVDLEAYRGGLPGSKTPVPNAAAPLFTSLLAELRVALRAKNPHAQLSMAAQIWPTAYPAYFYGGYNYTAIAREIDFFVVMGYDMIEDARLARRGTAPSDPPGSWDEHANAPLPGLIDGVEQYRKLGVDPSQLVMALPWYRLHATFVASLSLPLCVSLRCITYRLCLSVCFSVSLCVTQHM